MQNNSKKHIYVILMHTGTLPDKLIRFVTGYEYSHVVISLDKDCRTTYSFGRRSVHNFLNSGFVEEKQNGAFFQKFDKTRCRIYEIEVTEIQYKMMKNLLKYKIEHKNDYKYDFIGLFLRFFRIPVSFDNRAVCSQFVAEILEDGNIIHFEKPACFIRACDFDNREEFKTVYEGLYTDYQAN